MVLNVLITILPEGVDRARIDTFEQKNMYFVLIEGSSFHLIDCPYTPMPREVPELNPGTPARHRLTAYE
jgi:hypothetical protein